MAQRPPKAPDAQNYDPANPPHEGDGPRGRREGGTKTVRWEGCPLVPVDETKEPKMIAPETPVGVKVELMGWGAAGEVPKGKLKRNAPLDVVSDTFTIDDLHRLYGHGDYFCQAYTLSPTRGLQTPLGSKVWHILPCEFNDPDDENDPVEEEDDVGEAAWPGMDAFKESEPMLRKEMRRRATIRRELAGEGGGGRDRVGFDDEDDDGQPARGFRDRDRGGMRGRGMPPMGGRRPMQDDPEWMFDPNTRPTAPCPPGFMWAFGGNPMKWYHTEKTAEAVAAQAVPPPPTTLLGGMDPDIKAALLGIFTAVGSVFAKKLVDGEPAKPDPTLATIQALGALNKPADPIAIEQLRIDAEERRAATALAAENARIERENARIAAATEAAEKQRKHDAEIAAAQRAHDAKLEADRREAAAREAIAAEERAKQRAIEARNDLIALERMGLTGNKGPSPEQAAAERQLAVMSAQIEWMRNTPKTPDVMESFDKAKTLLTKLGVKVGESEDAAGSLLDALGTPAATAMATAIGPGLNAIMMKLAGASPEAQPPMQATVGVTLSAEELAKREQLAYETGIRRAREAMEAEHRAALAAQPPPPSLMDWQAVPAPVAEQPVAAAPAEQPAPVPEPVAEAPVAPVEEQPAHEPAPVTEAPAEAAEKPVGAVSEPAPEPAAEPAPEAPPVVAEVPAGAETPTEPEASEASEATAEEALGG